MKKGKIILISILGLLLLAIVYAMTRPGTRSFMNGQIPQEVSLQDVKIWSGVPGPEDMEISYDQELIFISSVERRVTGESTGFLYYIDLRKSPDKQKPVRLNIEYPPHFHPHGMSLRHMKDGNRIEIYVISHWHNGKEKIEVFQARRKNGGVEAAYKESITFNGNYNPNDLTVFPNGHFILSHDSKKDSIEKFNIMFNRKKALMSYFDGKKFTDLKHRTVMGNGILFKQQDDGSVHLYRADTIRKCIDILELRYSPGGIHWRVTGRIDLPSSPDNLIQDSKGNIYTACHYSFRKFVSHAMDPSKSAPTQVYRVSPSGEVILVYANDGSEYDAASVAIPYKRFLYLGQIFDDKILRGVMP